MTFARSLSLFVFAVLVLLAPAAQAVTTELEIDRPVVPAGNDQPVYVLVRFSVPEAAPASGTERHPLNLALVLDRSGSMAGAGKMAYLKQAAKAVVARMSPRDRVAVVEYDDEVTVAWPSTPVEAPDLVRNVIDRLEPRGSTNLSGGMVTGVEQVRGVLRGSSVNRVLLLSDGLANAGVVEPREIRALARQSKARGVPVTTLGLGLDYNEDLMQAVAQESGGNYHFIESPTQMAGIFQKELSALFRTTTRDVDLRFEAGGATEAVRVFGYPTHAKASLTTVEFPDFHGGEKRSLVLRLTPAPGGSGRIELGRLHFAYVDAATGERHEESHTIAVEVGGDDAVREAANREATIEAALVEAEETHGESLALLDAGRVAEAQGLVRGLAKTLNERNARYGDMRLAKKIEALTIEADDMAAADARFMKRSKNRLYLGQQGKRKAYMLSPGDRGEEVLELQRALKAAGAYAGPLDGHYSPDLERAVRAHQRRNNLAPDGVSGAATFKSLGLY